MIIIVLICWLAGFVLIWKVPRCLRESPFSSGPEGRDGGVDGEESPALRAAAKLGSVGVIIPARNEEQNLPRLLGSIPTATEVIVVDDDSTDATAAMARAAGARVVTAGTLPDGWRGKPWALTRGVAETNAEHFLFLDADTWFDAGGLGRILAEFGKQATVMSVLPYHHVPSAAEQLSAFFNLIMAASVGGFGVFSREPNGLFGQMLLIDRKTYASVGGHEPVRQHVLENVHLAPILRSAGARLRCFGGRGCLSMRMYPDGMRNLVEGWTKGFASGADATSRTTMLFNILWLTGAMMAATGLRIHHPISLGLYAMYAGQIFWMLRQLGSYWLLTALLYPIPLVFFFVVFANSVLRSRGTVTWKGRTIHAG